MACAGFYSCFDSKLTVADIVNSCQSKKWENLITRSADLFVIFANALENSLFVFTGQTGNFPCFYSIDQNHLIISPSFRLVNQSLIRRTLKPEIALELMCFAHLVLAPDQTVVNEIRQLPPATLLQIKGDVNVTIQPLIDRDQLLEKNANPFESVEEFTEALLETGKEVVEGYVEAINRFPLASELSSGFDSSLVCYLLNQTAGKKITSYTWMSPLMTQDTDPLAVSQFCQKHGLDNHQIDVSKLYPLCDDRGISWTQENFYPLDHGQEKAIECYNKIYADGRVVIFTGHGGDELYGTYNTLYKRFPIQHAHFHAVNSLKWDIGEILTPEGIELLLDRSRFSQKEYYPSYLSPSTLAVGQLYYPIWWESGLWPLMPLADKRLLAVARRIPKSLRNKDPRQKIWRHRTDIFLDSQFIPKGGPDLLIDQFIPKRRHLLIEILKHSILGNLGLVKANRLAEFLEKGEDHLFSKPGVLLYFHNLIRLELFLQYNFPTSP